MELVTKTRSVLRRAFPRPAKIALEYYHGVTGVLTSPKFRGLEMLERQNMLRKALAEHLTAAERKQVGLIVTLTPEEERFRVELENGVKDS